MQAPFARRIRWGAAALACASLLLLVGQLLHPDIARYTNPSLDPAGAARIYTSTTFVLADLVVGVAFTVLLFGIVGLYAYLAPSRVEHWAFGAMLLSLAGVGLFLPFHGIATFAFPAASQMYLDGQAGALHVISAILHGPAVLIAGVGLVFLALGSIGFGVAIWHCGTLPRWAGMLYALAFVLAIFVPRLSRVIRIIDGLLVGSAGVGIAWHIWRHPLPRPD